MKKIYFNNFRYFSIFIMFIAIISAFIGNMTNNQPLVNVSGIFFLACLWSVLLELICPLYVLINLIKKNGLTKLKEKLSELEKLINKKGFFTIKDLSNILNITIFESFLIINLFLRGSTRKNGFKITEESSWISKKIYQI